MKLMIEFQRVGVFEFFGDELKLRMVGGERVQNLRVTARRSRRFEQRQTVLGSIIKNFWRKILSFLKRRFHDRRIAVANHAVGITGRFHRANASMLMVAGGAGMVLRDVGLMKMVTLVTAQTVVVDGRKPNRPRLRGREGGRFYFVKQSRVRMTSLAVVGDVRVLLRDAAGVVKLLSAPKVICRHAEDSNHNHAESYPEFGAAQIVRLLVIIEIAFEPLGDRFLRSLRLSHAVNLITQQSDDCVPRRHSEEHKRKWRMDEQPAVKPVLVAGLQIELAAFVAPILHFLHVAVPFGCDAHF